MNFHRALVTGGAGFIGSHLVDALIMQGCEVRVVDDFSSGLVANLANNVSSDRLEIIKGDVNDRDLISQSLKDVEVVFHEAAIVSVVQSLEDPVFVNHVNVDGTSNVLSCAIREGVRRFVFASSAAVYGDQAEMPLKESALTEPISPYGEGKLRAEQECIQAYELTGLEVVALRYFNAYGFRSSGGSYCGVINKFIDRLQSMKSPIIYGSGEQTRDFVHVKDIVAANILAATSGVSAGKVFNVGTGVPISIKDLAEVISELIIGKGGALPCEYKLGRPGDIECSYADISLIKTTLGYEPQFKIKPGLSEYLQHTKMFDISKPIAG